MGSTYHGLHYDWVSVSKLESVKRYIAEQEAHHRRRTFEAELRELLERHGVQYNPTYLV